MRRLLATSFAVLALTACKPQAPDKPVVADAWVRLPAVAGRPAAGYFVLKGAEADDRLVSIDSAVVNKIELHEEVMNGGVMTMRQMVDVPLPKGADVAFAPGGKHAMLFGVDARITPGTAIPMLFTFQSGAKIEAEAKTVAAGGDMEHMNH
ncbi:MAG: copper chaperone PCu(A)C [Rhizorhabdus sp.]